MLKNEVILFVPGAKDLSKWPGITQSIVLFFSKVLRFKPTYHDQVKVWKQKFIFKRRRVVWMHWDRGIGLISKWFAKRKLSKLLKHYISDNVKLVGVSLGGDIILEVIRGNKYNNLKKIVLVCSINEIKNISFEHPKIVNIYSRKDNFSRIAIELYSPIHGGDRLIGKNVENVEIPNMTHDEFCNDAEIKGGKYKGKSVTWLVKHFLTD